MADINDIIATGIRPPQVETLGDAFRRMRAADDAHAAGQQQLTLGDLQTQEAQIRLDQAKRDQTADAAGRALFNPQAAQPDPGATAPGGAEPQTPFNAAAMARVGQPAAAAPQALPVNPQTGNPTLMTQPAPTQMSGPAAATPAPVTPAPGTPAPPPAPGPVAPPPVQAAPPQQPPAMPTQQQIFAAYGPVRGAQIVDAMAKAQASGLAITKAKGENAAAEQEYAANVGAMISAGGGTPQAFEQGMQMLESHGYGTEAQQLRNHVAQDPTRLASVVAGMTGASPKQADAAAATATAASRATTAATGASKQANEAPGQIALAAQQQRANAATQLAAAAGRGPDAVNALLNSMDPKLAAQFDGAKTPAEFLRKGLTAEQTVQSDQRDATLTQTKANDAALAGNRRAQLALEGQAQNLRQKTFDATVGQGLDANGQVVMDPSTGKPAVSPAAQMIGDYDMDPSAVGTRFRTPGFLAQVKAANPDYDAKNYAAARGIRTGKVAATTAANNTAIVHLDQLAELGKGMKNFDTQPANQLYNWAATTFGGANVTNFDALKNAVTGEVATALKGNATDVEIHNIAQTIASKSSPDQLAGFVQTMIPVLGAKLNTIDEQYHQAVGAKDPWHPVLPTAQAVLDKYSVPKKPVVTAPALPPAAKAQLKEGINTTFGNGQVWTLQGGKETRVK